MMGDMKQKGVKYLILFFPHKCKVLNIDQALLCSVCTQKKMEQSFNPN